MNFATEEIAEGAGVIVTVPGSHLDASTVRSFREALQPLIEAHSAVLIDLRQIEFIDSSGLGSLLSVLRNLNNKQGELKLFGMSKPVQAMFELVRMHRLFAIYNTREEALATL